MGKRRKMTREELEERLQRERQFHELLDRRIEVDRRLAAERGEPALPFFSLAQTRDARRQRDRALREVLRRRVEVDRRLAAERAQRTSE
jgi:hypothetical protein